jgi:hypothetical protein
MIRKTLSVKLEHTIFEECEKTAAGWQEALGLTVTVSDVVRIAIDRFLKNPDFASQGQVRENLIGSENSEST